MFMGHYGPAVWDTQRGKGEVLVPLWIGFIAVQFIDVIWACLTILGIEGGVRMTGDEPLSNIPYSHSLVTALIWSAIGGFLFKIFRPKAGAKGFWVIFALVFSHWVFDLIVHRPDLPLWPGSKVELGFGIWNWPIVAFVLEIGLLFAAFLYWMRVTTEEHQSSILKLRFAGQAFCDIFGFGLTQTQAASRCNRVRSEFCAGNIAGAFGCAALGGFQIEHIGYISYGC